MALVAIGILLILVIIYMIHKSAKPSESYTSCSPFTSGDNCVQVDASGGETITGVEFAPDTYQLYVTWNGKTYDVDWQVCNLPEDTWEFILFPHRTMSLITYYKKDKQTRCSMVEQARFVRRGTFGHYLYVFQTYKGNTHMRRVPPYVYILMGKPAAVDMYMGMAPAIHPLKPVYTISQVPNPPNISPKCKKESCCM